MKYSDNCIKFVETVDRRHEFDWFIELKTNQITKHCKNINIIFVWIPLETKYFSTIYLCSFWRNKLYKWMMYFITETFYNMDFWFSRFISDIALFYSLKILYNVAILWPYNNNRNIIFHNNNILIIVIHFKCIYASTTLCVE